MLPPIIEHQPEELFVLKILLLSSMFFLNGLAFASETSETSKDPVYECSISNEDITKIKKSADTKFRGIFSRSLKYFLEQNQTGVVFKDSDIKVEVERNPDRPQYIHIDPTIVLEEMISGAKRQTEIALSMVEYKSLFFRALLTAKAEVSQRTKLGTATHYRCYIFAKVPALEYVALFNNVEDHRLATHYASEKLYGEPLSRGDLVLYRSIKEYKISN